jgi:ATP-dependent exoDNAse (exonuclease V) alpha subunit
VTAAFRPADGDRARWRYAYDLVAGKQPGEDVTLLELAELLDLDVDQDRALLRAVMSEAKKHLERDHLHTVRTVDKFGWVVIDARGNLDEIEKRRKKATRATGRAARLIVATDREQLSPIERQRLDFETRSVLSAKSLFERKTKDFTELERQSAKRQTPELPFRKPKSA